MADTDKNIYSLVLSDDVIDEIDSMARSAGLSRSAMVNQILAEKTRCITPEMRVKQITNAIREAVGGEFYLAQQPSPATVACRTALKYRYKPTLRYSVELFAVARKRTGELKVSVRSQSGQLNDDLTGFFQCWVKLEQKYLADKITRDLMFRIEPGKFVRTLDLPPKEVSDEKLGQAVAAYMEMLDETMKLYFSYLPDAVSGARAAERCYVRLLPEQEFII